MLNINDIEYLSSSVYETHLIVGTPLDFLIPLPSEDDIYQEDRFKKFHPPIQLHGLVVPNPTDGISPLGLKENVTITFSFSSKELMLKRVPRLEKELLKCFISYNGKMYSIVTVIPYNNVQDTCIGIKFECRCL